MATIKFSNSVVDARGKIGGMQFNKTASTNTIQRLSHPPARKTSKQMFWQAYFAFIAHKWSTFTTSQKNHFTSNSRNFPEFNQFNQLVTKSGYCQLIRGNMLAYYGTGTYFWTYPWETYLGHYYGFIDGRYILDIDDRIRTQVYFDTTHTGPGLYRWQIYWGGFTDISVTTTPLFWRPFGYYGSEIGAVEDFYRYHKNYEIGKDGQKLWLKVIVRAIPYMFAVANFFYTIEVEDYR